MDDENNSGDDETTLGEKESGRKRTRKAASVNMRLKKLLPELIYQVIGSVFAVNLLFNKFSVTLQMEQLDVCFVRLAGTVKSEAERIAVGK